MDPKDELLAKLKAIDAEANPPTPELKPVSPPPAPAPRPEPAPKISTDDFLAKLEALDQATRPTAPPVPSVAPPSEPSPAPPPLPSQGYSGATQPAPSRSGTPPSPSSSPASPSPGMRQPYVGFPNVIERLKQFTQEQLATHAAQNQAKVKRAQEISRAQTWLDELDPLSDDGFWFEQFAESYESRLQAALDFLDPGRSR